MNRESIVMGLFGLGLGLTLCSVVIAFTFSKVTRTETLTLTSGTYMISLNWVWLCDLFLTAGLGLFIVSALYPVSKRINVKTLLTLIPLSALYLLIAALDVVSTDRLIKSGLGNEVNPIMAMLINSFGLSYALSLNFVVSVFIVIGLIYFTERLHVFSAVILPISFIRGMIVYNNMILLKNYTLNTWFLILQEYIITNIPMMIIFFTAVAGGLTISLAFPEEEGEYRLSLRKAIMSFNPLKLRTKTEQSSIELTKPEPEKNLETSEEYLIDPVEFALLLERYKMKQEIVETLLKVCENISRKKGIPMDKVTLKDIIDELNKKL